VKQIFVIGIFLSAAWPASGQLLSRKNVDIDKLIDEILAIQDEDINYEDLYENLLQLYTNQADLNLISAEQLRSLYVLKEQQIQAFLNYREEAGPFLSEYELQNIEGFTPEVINQLLPFVTVQDPAGTIDKSFWRRVLHEKNNFLILRIDRTLEDKKGYLRSTPESSRYSGSPERLYSRFQVRRPGDFSFGFTAEKDAGEQWRWAPAQKQFGPDFLSFHGQVLNKGKIKNLIVGDFQAQFGQGLVLGSAFGIGKNAEAVNTIRRGNLGFLPYTSAYEARYLRGLALTYAVTPNVFVNVMASSQWRDGRIQQDTTSESSELISSFQITGFHRTPSERAGRSTVLEKNLAAVLNYRNKSWDAGLLLHYTHFNVPVQRTPNLYNQYYFEGNQNTNAGFFLNYSWNNFAFFSEGAQTVNHGMGLIAGLLGSVTSTLDVSLLFRKYDRDFITFYSNALSENTTPQNENGIYWGWKYMPSKKYSFTGYVDLFRFPWLRYRSYTLSNGNEWLLRMNYRPSRNITLFAQVREEVKVRNSTSTDNLYRTAPGIRRNYWINADYDVTPSLSLRTRAQFSRYELANTATHGMVLLQDITWRWRNLTLSARYALFDTDDYDNRIYIYERDVWLAFSFPAYYGVGIRNYVLLQYRITKKIDVWLRWAQTRYTDRDRIGSGTETIEGNVKNDFKIQTRIRL
jgi:hypothetical protein